MAALMNLRLLRPSERACSTPMKSDFNEISMPTKFVSGRLADMAHMNSPVPQPISSSRGCALPNSCSEVSLGNASMSWYRSFDAHCSKYLAAVGSSGGLARTRRIANDFLVIGEDCGLRYEDC